MSTIFYNNFSTLTIVGVIWFCLTIYFDVNCIIANDNTKNTIPVIIPEISLSCNTGNGISVPATIPAMRNKIGIPYKTTDDSTIPFDGNTKNTLSPLAAASVFSIHSCRLLDCRMEHSWLLHEAQKETAPASTRT